MFCTLCGSNAYEDAGFCPGCGVRLFVDFGSIPARFADYAYCAVCGAKSIDMYCEKCGSATKAVDRFRSGNAGNYAEKATEWISGTAGTAKKYVDKVAERITGDDSKKRIGAVKEELAGFVKEKKYKSGIFPAIAAVLILISAVYSLVFHDFAFSFSSAGDYYSQKDARTYLFLTVILAVIIIAGYYGAHKKEAKGDNKSALDIIACIALAIIIINGYIFYSFINSKIEYLVKPLFVIFTVAALVFIGFKAYFLFESSFPEKKEKYLKSFVMPDKLALINDICLGWLNSAMITVIAQPFFYNPMSSLAFIIQFLIILTAVAAIIFLKSRKNVYNL